MLRRGPTADRQIDYSAAETAIQWWVDFNGADATPDIDMAEEVWSFLSRFDRSGPIAD